jgi:predicted Rossmann fold flavoprotein
MEKLDVIIIGAGAAGLMCAIEAGKRKRSVMVLDHANRPGKKILMSGGGRCNFTNYYINPSDYISHNPSFCKSALSRYTQWDFIDMVQRHQIPFHEKTLGQLFCDNKSKDILDMLLLECDQVDVTIRLNTAIESIEKKSHGYLVKTTRGEFTAESLVIASGGLSIPTMGASPFAYKVAEQFGLRVWPTRAGLVPFTLHTDDKTKLAELSGVSVDSLVSNAKSQFRENILFTHRGLSGPAVLQISSYWQPGEAVIVNLLPDVSLYDYFKHLRLNSPLKQIKSILVEMLPRRLVEIFIHPELVEKKIADAANRDFELLAQQLHHWEVRPNGTEGYRTAEVTLGGVDCDALSSKTLEVTGVEGLYFIGEAVDVTGWLGGYNFQWAWSSGWAAGQAV